MILRRCALGCALALTLSVPAHAAINANKSFTPDVVSIGQVSTVTFFFLNANTSAATALAFTDAFPAGIIVAPSPGTSTTCGGAIAANAGDPSVTFSGGTVPAAAGTTPGSCQVTVDVVAAAPDVYINTIAAGDVTSSEGGNTQPAEATLNVSALRPISGSKAFAPTVLHGYGNASVVTITLTNPNGVALTNVTFTDTLPAQLVVDATPGAATTCGGTLTANAGANNASLAGGTIPTNGSCTVSYRVAAANPNAAFNANVQNTLPAGTIATFEGPTNPLITSNNLLVQTGAQLVKAFAPTPILSGGTSTLTVTVRNYNASAIGPLGFTDPLPAGMTIANPLTTGGTCVSANGASFTTAVVGGNTYTTGGGTLNGVAANAGNTFTSCTFTIAVTATNAGPAQVVLNNSIAAGNFAGVAYATSNTASLTVNAPSSVSGTKAFSTPNGPAVRTNGILATVVIANAAGTPATGVAMTDLLTTMGTGFTFAAVPAATTTCGGSFGATGGTTVMFTGGSIPAASSCTLTYPIQIGPTASTGNRTNTIPIGNVTATIAAATVVNTVPLTATISVGAALGVAKAFAPTTVLAGANTRLTITVSHANGAVAFDSIAFTDNLPAGHVVANPNGFTNTCGGAVTAVPGTGSVALSGGALGTGTTSCAVGVNITTPAGAGSATNTLAAGSVTSVNQGVSNASAASATINRVTGTVSLSKSFAPATVALNGTSVMRLRILNNAPGAVALTGVTLSDPLPTGMVVHSTPAASFSGTGCSPAGVTAPANGSTVAISGKSIAAGSICTIQVTVRATVAGNLINSLPAGAVTSAQGVSNVDPASATLSSTGLADLSVTKTDGVAQIAAGTSTTYTVAVGNAAGSATVTGAMFTDPEPANATFTSWSCVASAGASCTANGSGPINDTVTIPANGTLTYSITAAVTASASGQVVNIANIEPPASVIDSNTANNTATDTDTIVQTVALAVTKTDNSTQYVPGGSGTYVITVTNAGPSDGAGISFSDTLPDVVVIAASGVSCTPSGAASCGVAGANTAGTQAVTFTGMQIAAGAGNSVQVTVPVSYPAPMTITPLANTGTATHVASGNTANGQDSSARSPDVELAVSKDDGSATYVPGGTATYTVVVTNNGDTHASSVAVTDPLPTGVTLSGNVTCASSAGSNCGTVTGTTGQAAFGTTSAVIAGGGGTLTFTVPVAFDATMTSASITNTVTATATDPQLPPPGTVTALADDTDTRAPVDLAIVKSHAGNFFQGQVGATFSITVTNNGPSPSFGLVTVSDVVPAGFTATSIAGTNWSCTQPAGPCTRSDALGATQSYETITLVVDVAAAASSPLVNQATVSGGGDPTPATTNDTVVVDAGRDLTVAKTHAGNFFQGQVGATFTISVSNVGGTASSGLVTVTDPLPSGLTATMIGGSGWSCTQPAGPCTRSDALAPLAAYPDITLTVDVASDAVSLLVNVATVGGGGDLNPANNDDNDTVTVALGADLAIAKAHAGNFSAGQVGATYAITVSNVGNSATSGTVTVIDTPPAGLTATAMDGPGWSCVVATLTCTRSDPLGTALAYPAITLTVNVANPAPPSVVNVASVSGGGDIDPTDNTAADPTTIVAATQYPVPVLSPLALAMLGALLALMAWRRTRRHP